MIRFPSRETVDIFGASLSKSIMTVTYTVAGQVIATVSNSVASSSAAVRRELGSDGDSEDVDITLPLARGFEDIVELYVKVQLLADDNTLTAMAAGQLAVSYDGYPVVTNPVTLRRSFDLETTLEDDLFFKYLMVQVYQIWSDFQPHLNYVAGLILFYLHTPLPLVPDSYLNSRMFMRDWLATNLGNGGSSSGGDSYNAGSRGRLSLVINQQHHTFYVVAASLNYYPDQLSVGSLQHHLHKLQVIEMIEEVGRDITIINHHFFWQQTGQLLDHTITQ